MDNISSEARSYQMSLVRSKNTKPEMHVRGVLKSLGLKFRSHLKTLSGSPDFVFPEKRKTIFVHGCFWHGHKNCKNARIPKSRTDFWINKIRGNQLRDKRCQRKLNEAGWSYKIIWECQLKEPNRLIHRLKNYLLEMQ